MPEHTDFANVAETLLTNVRDLLDDPEARTRVRAIHSLSIGMRELERRVLQDSQKSGVTWAEIGRVYGVTRQAVHRRFSEETVVPSDFFDALLSDLQGEPEVVAALAQAAKRARHAAQSH